MKALKKNDLGVSPVIAVILMVAITVVLAGVVFLWAQSFTDDTGGTVKNLNIDVTLTEGASTANVLSIEVLGGTIDWSDYEVRVNTTAMTTTSTTSNAGDTAYFTGFGIVKGESYKVSIIDLGNNKVVYNNDDVIAIGA